VAYPAYGWGFGVGFPFFGLIFAILFFIFIFAVIRRAVWGGSRGWGAGYRGGWGYGPGGWDRKSVPPMADEMLQGWHRRAHGEEPAAKDQ
jgi:hypothetical protein